LKFTNNKKERSFVYCEVSLFFMYLFFSDIRLLASDIAAQ